MPDEIELVHCIDLDYELDVFHCVIGLFSLFAANNVLKVMFVFILKVAVKYHCL